MWFPKILQKKLSLIIFVAGALALLRRSPQKCFLKSFVAGNVTSTQKYCSLDLHIKFSNKQKQSFSDVL